MNICQKCGDKSNLKKLVYCVQCRVSAQHRYCLDELPKNDHDKVAWTCEECIPEDAKRGPVPSRKSERIIRTAEVRLNRMEIRKQINFPSAKARIHVDRLPAAKQFGDFSLWNEEFKNPPSGNQNLGDQEFRRQKRRLVLENGEISDEESEPVKVEASKLAPAVYNGSFNKSSSLPSLGTGNYCHARPVLHPIWRGCFIIGDVENRTVVGLVAHLSTKACSKVSNAATALPPLLNVDILSRSDAWPKKFQISPPSDDSIALFIFPENERNEKVFDGLLDDIIDRNLALKAVINNVDLLVFSSRELPSEHWRLCNKYYLWGVFRQKSNSLPFEPTSHLVLNSGPGCIMTSNLTNDSRG